MEKLVTLKIYSVGYNGVCNAGTGLDSCSSGNNTAAISYILEMIIQIDDYPISDTIKCTSFNQTCLITISTNIETLANSIVSVSFPSSNQYNQGWTWEISVYSETSNNEFIR